MGEYDYFDMDPEKAKKARKEAYRQAKLEREADPEFIALQEEHKRYKKNQYLKAKEEFKAMAREERENRKLQEAEKAEQKRRKKMEGLRKLLKPASELEKMQKDETGKAAKGKG